jgi:hypothetical protein
MPATRLPPAIERFSRFIRACPARSAKTLDRVRDTSGICSRRRGDLPVGQFCVESPLQKYFCFHTLQITSRTFRIPSHRGAYRDRHGRGMGCGGRGSVLRATGLQGGFFESVSDQRAGGREMLQRTAKSCGPDAPTLASSSRSCVGPTGLRQNLSADDGGKQARSPGRARRKPLKPLRAGMSGVPVYSLLLVCFLPLQSAHEAAGAVGTRHSPRPLWGGR